MSLEQPSEDGEYGSLTIEFSERVRSVSIEIDNQSVAENKYTRKVQVSHIPSGRHTVKVNVSDKTRNSKIDIEDSIILAPGQNKVMLMEAPPRNGTYWVYQSIPYMIVFITAFPVIYFPVFY